MNIKKFHHKILNLDQLLHMILLHLEILLQIFVYKFLLIVLHVIKPLFHKCQLIDKIVLGNNLFQNQVTLLLTLKHLQHKCNYHQYLMDKLIQYMMQLIVF